MKSVMSLTLIASIALFSVLVEANEEELLLASCRALNSSQSAESTQPCKYYIDGFIAGAVATDTVNSIERTEEVKNLSAFVERAYRTRMGEVDSRAQATQFMHFCVPDDAAKESVITKLSKHFTHSIETTDMLKTTVYKALSTEYPCR